MFEPDEPGWCRTCGRQNDDHASKCRFLVDYLDRMEPVKAPGRPVDAP